MQRNQQYFILRRKDPSVHHFIIYYFHIDKCVDHYTWDGRDLKKEDGCWGGFVDISKEIDNEIPLDLKPVTDQIKQFVLQKHGEPKIQAIQYRGFACEVTIESIITMDNPNHKDISPLMNDPNPLMNDPNPLMNDPNRYNTLHFDVIVRLNSDGKYVFRKISSGSTCPVFIDPINKVLDYFVSTDNEILETAYRMKTFHNSLHFVKDGKIAPELIDAIMNDRLMLVEVFNQAHNLKPEISLNSFGRQEDFSPKLSV